MNLFSRIGAAVKYAATGHLSMSTLAGGLEGAMMHRRLVAWKATQENINGLLSSGGDLLRARARQIVRANPYASNACESFVANAVGAGVKPSSLVADQALKDEIQKTWLDWTDEADADGLTDFYGLQALAVRAMFEAGECFIRFRPRRPGDGLTVPLQLQLLEAEMLPLAKTEIGASGNQIRCGIEFDAIGRRVAYHFYRNHPGDGTIVQNQGESVRVPASEILHIYRPQRPGQIRGVPWMSPALVKLYLLDQYDDAELDRKKVAALFAGFITKASPEDNLLGESAADADGSSVAGLSPGTMQVLLPGEDIKFSSPADVGGSYEMFQYRTLLSIAAALGVPYTNVTGDLKAANYSSIRAGTVEFRRRLEQFQFATLVFQMCRPIWQRWIQTAALSGALSLPNFASDPSRYTTVKWITPKWEWVDPLKDRQAEKIAQEQGWKAPSDIIEAEGNDVDETFRRIAADQKRIKDLGITLGPLGNQTPPVTPEPTNDNKKETPPSPPTEEPDQTP
ncbi:MAG: phage portal protein [Alphaproteobacteria bacterium]|nr:phage portal protein [Alphaproteobacteria bacterium]